VAPTGTPADAILSRQAQIWPVYPTRSPAAGYTIEDIPTLRHWNEMALHRESSIPELGEIPVITRNGDVRTWLLSRATLGRLPDRRNLALLAAVDLTEPHKTEEPLRKANLELEQYAFAASHDLQEQMRVTGLYIMREAARMTAVVSGLISYSRLVCESDPIQQQSVSLADLVTRIVSEFPQGADSQAAQITVEPLPEVQGEPDALSSVIRHLLSNAIKYLPPWRPATDPHFRVARPRNLDRFDARHNGVGVPREYHERIWGVFKRLHGHEIPGTGIGLAVVRKVIQQHGGRAWVESSGSGSGSTSLHAPRPCGNTRARGQPDAGHSILKLRAMSNRPMR